MGTLIVRMRGSKREKIRHTALAPARELTTQFAQTGQTDGFEELVRRYSAFIYSLCYRITQDQHDAEDATQIAFLQLAIAIKSGSTIDKPVGWLQSVAKRQAARIIRGRSRARRREQRASRDEAQELNYAAAMDEHAVAGIVRDALEELPEHYRLPLVLHYFSGMSLEAIATELKSTPRTIGTRLHRGRKMLAGRLEKAGLRFTPDSLLGLLTIVIPSAIARRIAERVTVAASGAPRGLAQSIVHTVRLSLGSALRRKLVIAAVLLASAASTLALSPSHGWSSLRRIDFSAVGCWIHRLIEPRVIRLSQQAAPAAQLTRFAPQPLPAPTAAANLIIAPTAPAEFPPSNHDRVNKAPKKGSDPFFIADGKSDPVCAAAQVIPVTRAPTEALYLPANSTSDSPHPALAPVSAATCDSSAMKQQHSPKPPAPPAESPLLGGGAAENLSGTYPTLTVPPFNASHTRLRGFGEVNIDGDFTENGRVVADGKGAGKRLDLSHTSPVNNTIDNPADGSNGWYAVNGGILSLPPLHVDSSENSYTWGESATDPQIDLINSVRMRVNGLHHDGVVSLSLQNLSTNPRAFSSLPAGWGIVGLWKIDAGDMTADSLDVTIRYNQIAAGFLPAGDQLLTFLTYDGQWQSMDFSDVLIDRSSHLISGELTQPFDYFAVAGPLEPVVDEDLPRFSVNAPEPAVGCVTIAFLLIARRRKHFPR